MSQSQKKLYEQEIRKSLHQLMDTYRASDHYIFIQFSYFLSKYEDSFLSSFTEASVSRRTQKNHDTYYARLSNGPIESFNQKPKHYKRNSRDSSYIDYTRNQILWATKKDPKHLGIPRTCDEVHSRKRKERGSS